MITHLKTIITLCALFFMFISWHCTIEIKRANEALSHNIEVLNDTIHQYKVCDSLNAATIAELQFSKDELFKLYREDKELIKQLTKKVKLLSVKKVESVKRDTCKIELRDTILIDSAKCFTYNSEWTDVSGIVYDDSISINIENRESLLITESKEKKKFLGIRLPIWLFGYKYKRIDVVSRNPNTKIQSVDYINIR